MFSMMLGRLFDRVSDEDQCVGRMSKDGDESSDVDTGSMTLLPLVGFGVHISQQDHFVARK